MDSPGFCKPAHGYGQPFGTSPDTNDDNWAGDGYAGVPAPEALEPVERPA